MKIRTYPMLFTDCRNSVGKYFLDGEGNFALPRLWKDPQTPGPDRVKYTKIAKTPFCNTFGYHYLADILHFRRALYTWYVYFQQT